MSEIQILNKCLKKTPNKAQISYISNDFGLFLTISEYFGLFRTCISPNVTNPDFKKMPGKKTQNKAQISDISNDFGIFLTISDYFGLVFPKMSQIQI